MLRHVWASPRWETKWEGVTYRGKKHPSSSFSLHFSLPLSLSSCYHSERADWRGEVCVCARVSGCQGWFVLQLSVRASWRCCGHPIQQSGLHAEVSDGLGDKERMDVTCWNSVIYYSCEMTKEWKYLDTVDVGWVDEWMAVKEECWSWQHSFSAEEEDLQCSNTRLWFHAQGFSSLCPPVASVCLIRKHYCVPKNCVSLTRNCMCW